MFGCRIFTLITEKLDSVVFNLFVLLQISSRRGYMCTLITGMFHIFMFALLMLSQAWQNNRVRDCSWNPKTGNWTRKELSFCQKLTFQIDIMLDQIVSLQQQVAIIWGLANLSLLWQELKRFFGWFENNQDSNQPLQFEFRT